MDQQGKRKRRCLYVSSAVVGVGRDSKAATSEEAAGYYLHGAGKGLRRGQEEWSSVARDGDACGRDGKKRRIDVQGPLSGSGVMLAC